MIRIAQARAGFAITTASLLLLLSTFPAWAGDAEAGKAKSEECVECHGEDGNSPEPENPKIAGQHYQALVESMLAYKEKRRKHRVMQALMRPLTEEDIRDLAAFYASQPCR